MNPLSTNTTIKLGVQHNISSLKMIEGRFDLNQTVLAVKEFIEARFGSEVSFMRLELRDGKNNLIANMDQDIMTLAHYGAQTGMIIYVNDLNPNSIHKQIESFEGVQKYVISEEDYDKLPENFRKWKKQLLAANPHLLQNINPATAQSIDPEYMSQLASSIQVGNRCKLDNGARGEVGFVGYYVGVKLDEPYGNGNGEINGVKYFECQNKYGVFVRPNMVQVGDFPVLDIDDQI